MHPELSRSLVSARTEIAKIRETYDSMAAGGIAGSEREQGFGNYYRDDPPERRNIDFFVEQVKEVSPVLGSNVLVVGGDGLAAQFLAEAGLYPTGFDISPQMVAASRKRFAATRLKGEFYVGDATDLDCVLFPDSFAGVAFPHIIPCIPIVGMRDDLLRKAVTDLSSRAPGGPFYIANTYYDDPLYQRRLMMGGKAVGDAITYYHRPVEVVAEMVEGLGRRVLQIEHYDSALDPANEYSDYKNWYLNASPVQ